MQPIIRFSVLSAFLIIITAYTVYSQRFHGGIEAGIVASEVSGDNLSGPNKLGWHASVYTFTPLTEFSSIQLKIMYIEKGSRAVINEKNDYEYLFLLQYVEVPVLLLWDISRFSQSPVLENLVFETGLSGSTLVGHREEEFGNPIPTSEVQDFHPAELNILLGLSYPIGDNVNFRFGFSNSITPLRPHSGGGKVWYNRGQYNSLWTLALAWNFW